MTDTKLLSLLIGLVWNTRPYILDRARFASRLMTCHLASFWATQVLVVCPRVERSLRAVCVWWLGGELVAMAGVAGGNINTYILRILSFSAAVSETFASGFVLNLVWDSRRLRFPAFVLALSIAFLKGRARRAPTGVLPCARLGVSPPTSSATPLSEDFCWGEETRRFYFLRSWRFV